MYMRYILCIRFETGTLDEHIPIAIPCNRYHVTDHEIDISIWANDVNVNDRAHAC